MARQKSGFLTELPTFRAACPDDVTLVCTGGFLGASDGIQRSFGMLLDFLIAHAHPVATLEGGFASEPSVVL